MRRWLLLLLVPALTVGCSSRKYSMTPRTAIEQLLLAEATDRALDKLDMPMLRGAKVFVDFTNLKCVDAEYVKVAIRTRVARLGSILVESADKADYTMEVSSGALALEHKEALLGIPSIPVPQAGVPLPEVAFWKTVEQTAIMKLLLFVHKKGTFVAADEYYAKADRDESFLLWWRFHRSDDIRQGWEQADLKVEQQRSVVARPAPGPAEAPKPTPSEAGPAPASAPPLATGTRPAGR